jgi:hypothetical protein
MPRRLAAAGPDGSSVTRRRGHGQVAIGCRHSRAASLIQPLAAFGVEVVKQQGRVPLRRAAVSLWKRSSPVVHPQFGSRTRAQ